MATRPLAGSLPVLMPDFPGTSLGTSCSLLAARQEPSRRKHPLTTQPLPQVALFSEFAGRLGSTSFSKLLL